eukprot:scaffold5874_cov140-Isochrysis_galbana.AAC.6
MQRGQCKTIGTGKQYHCSPSGCMVPADPNKQAIGTSTEQKGAAKQRGSERATGPGGQPVEAGQVKPHRRQDGGAMERKGQS